MKPSKYTLVTLDEWGRGWAGDQGDRKIDLPGMSLHL